MAQNSSPASPAAALLRSEVPPEIPPPATPEQLLARLAELGIPSRTVRHPPVFTVEESKALRGELPGGHVKNLFLRDKKGALWLVVAQEDRRIDLKELARRIGAGKVSFASPERLMRHLGVVPGAVTPFGLINDRAAEVRVVIDRALLEQDPVNVHPLANDRTTAIAPRDLLRFIEACGHTPRILDLGP